nr:retrovirus-related Pol polyprotein from transposon 297 family [Tanacetum cinerariifolium]
MKSKTVFAINNVHEDDKVKIVSIHLYDKALAWHLQFLKTHGETMVWNVYEEGILKRFGTVNEDPMAELKNLGMFVAGLPATMEMNVRMFRPQTLADAFSLANFQEASLAVIKQKSTPLLPTPKFNNHYYANKNVNYPNKATTVTTPAPNTQVVNKYPALPSPAPRKQLSQKEFANKRAKNLCFYCDKKYVPGHKCSGQMYALEISPLEEDADLSLEETLNEANSSQLMLCYYPWEDVNWKESVSELQFMSGKQLSREVVDRGASSFSSINCLWPTASMNLMQTGLEPNTPYDPQLRNLLQEPYRYHLNQKDVIEQMVNELLDTGVAMMNSAFKPFLRKFTLVFFDDILLYNPSMATHLHHLRQVLQVMREHTLYAKESNYVFGTNSVEYLGHIISARGVATDPKKIEATQAWPVPTKIKQLRGFLGLTRYYKRFIQGYASVSQPLTILLKKNALLWTSEAQVSFEKLKQASTEGSVLALLDFNEEFIIEIDASGYGIGFDYEIEYKKRKENVVIDALSRVQRQRKSTILVLVDRLSKYAHFIPVTYPYTAKTIAQLFLDHIYKIHGLPKSIVINRDKVFMSLFWQSLFKMLQVQIKMSTAYHPQSDGQTEVVNKCLECYIRLPLLRQCMDNHQLFISLVWLRIAELVDRTLQAREKAIQMLQFNLRKAQDRMKSQADKHRFDMEFEVYDWVYLKIQPYRQVTIRKGKQHKLSSKFYGPFQVIAKVGKVAYKLQLPEKPNKTGVFGLIQWSNDTEEDATWEDLADIMKRFPDFVLDS